MLRFTDANFLTNEFGFHAQQAVEKALKAWVSMRDIQYPHVHDLKMLRHVLEDAGETDIRRFVALADLTDFAMLYRYDIFDDAPIERLAVLKHCAHQ